MHYVKHFNINGIDTKQVACIELRGKPNAATEGYVGVLGIDILSPLHDVYKCVAKNGSIYTWELLSSGTCIMSSIITGAGEELAEFPYDKLRTVANYVVKVGDVIIDKEGFLYQVETLNTTYCIARYNGTQIVSGVPKVGQVDNGKIFSVVDGCHAWVPVGESSVAKYVEKILPQHLAEIAPYSLVQPTENGDFPLEIGKTYKVFFERNGSATSGKMLKVTYCDPQSYNTDHELISKTNNISYPSYESINYFTITPLRVRISSGYGYDTLAVDYSVNGEETSWSVIGTSDSNTFHNVEPVTVSITGATKCLLQNEEPYIRL